MEQTATQGVTVGDLARQCRDSKVPAIEALPPKLRTQIVDMLIANASLRDVSARLLQSGVKLSHQSIARYKNQVLKPALEAGAKLRSLQPVSHDPVEQAKETAVATKQALAAQPLLARTDALWSEIQEDLSESKKGDRDYKARASLVQAGAKLIDTHAKLTGAGAYGQQQNAGTVVQIAVMAAGADPAKPVVDVQIAEVGRRDG